MPSRSVRFLRPGEPVPATVDCPECGFPMLYSNDVDRRWHCSGSAAHPTLQFAAWSPLPMRTYG